MKLKSLVSTPIPWISSRGVLALRTFAVVVGCANPSSVVFESYLGEQRGPDGLDVDATSLDQGLELVGLSQKTKMSAESPVGAVCDSMSHVRVCSYGDLNTIIGEDEGGVGRCQLSGRHFECVIWLRVAGK